MLVGNKLWKFIHWLFTMKKGFKPNSVDGKFFLLLLLRGYQHKCLFVQDKYSLLMWKLKDIISYPSSGWSGGCEWSFQLLSDAQPTFEFFHTNARLPPLLIRVYLRWSFNTQTVTTGQRPEEFIAVSTAAGSWEAALPTKTNIPSIYPLSNLEQLEWSCFICACFLSL